MDQVQLITLALSLVILLFSVVVHEVMHGYMALKFGDHTAENAGRLTLNPIPHIDPIGTILMPAFFIVLPLLTGVHSRFFIGWAKPVPVNPLNFRNIKTGELVVSLAGIVSNFVLAIIAALLYHLTTQFDLSSLLLQSILVYAVSINLMLGVFNLFPIPPLDGSKVLMALLPYSAAREYERYSEYGFIVLIILLYLGIVGSVLGFIIPSLQLLLGVPQI